MSAGILRTTNDDSFRIKAGEPSSPVPSVDRLSVTFALDEPEPNISITKEADETTEQVHDAHPLELEVILAPNDLQNVQTHSETRVETPASEQVADENDEYADIIMEIQRSRSRGSMRRNSGASYRRKSGSLTSSSLFSSRRRTRMSSRASSSGDSLLSSKSSKGDADTLKLHREVIEQVKYQLWPLDKKMRILQQAKEYVKKHESEMEERLAQSKTCASRVKQMYFYVIKFIYVSRKRSISVCF